MEGVGCQDTCGVPTVHDYGIGGGEGEITIVLFSLSLERLVRGN